ncbi:MAG: OadG family protein [Candidatus Cloacimonas sp.]|nr:OadG family protein [Candidatus Cloacimonas sp.]
MAIFLCKVSAMRKIVFIVIAVFCIVSAGAQISVNAPTISDSLSLARGKEILSEYGFRDTAPLAEVANKLQIKDIDRWKSYLGLEPQNEKLDKMSLRKLGITPYKALLAQQYSIYGYTELSTLEEVAAALKMPVKKIKQDIGLDKPNSQKWDSYSLQSLNITPEDIKKIHRQFEAKSLNFGLNITLVGMLTVFAALLITSIIIGQLNHLNRPPKEKKADLKISPGGKVRAASATLNHNVIVALAATIFLYEQSLEEKRKIALTFKRTPTNQWRASSMLNMPNREIYLKRR